MVSPPPGFNQVWATRTEGEGQTPPGASTHIARRQMPVALSMNQYHPGEELSFRICQASLAAGDTGYTGEEHRTLRVAQNSSFRQREELRSSAPVLPPFSNKHRPYQVIKGGFQLQPDREYAW